MQLEDVQIPVEIHHEWRQSARVSIGRDKAIIRLPILIASSTREEHLNWAKDWLLKKIRKDKTLRSHFYPKNYTTGTELLIRGTIFTLHIDNLEEGDTACGRRLDRSIHIQIPKNLSPRAKHKTIQTLLHKIMSQTYLLHVKKRVEELNQAHFQKAINRITLKNNTSNWGSCSSNRNISLSSRLLLAPAFILDYIIIHELAHLVHHNHSQQYWNLVEKVMPEYMEAENWLKMHGSELSW